MATIRPSRRRPDVLLAYGDDIAHDTYREDLRRELLDNRSSRVRRGTHHFWITYFVPTTDGGEFNDGDLTTRPRKFRGVIRMGRLPGGTGPGDVAGHMRRMLEEVGHHWLVRSDMQFAASGRRRLGLTPIGDWTAAVNRGAGLTGLPGLPLLGRMNVHWGSYVQADKSPLDGQWWTEPGQEGPLTRWTNRAWQGEMIKPDGLAEVQLATQFSDLDLAIMGKISRRNAYATDGNELAVIDPVRVAPVGFHLGACVCFSRSDIVVFGFDRDHRALGVYRTSGSSGGSQIASVSPAALAQTPFGVALRVVRRGNDYHFQARGDASVAAHLAPEPRDLPRAAALAPRVPGLFDGIDKPARPVATPDLAGWATIATVRSTAAPQAVGLTVDKWEGLVTGGFFNLEIRTPDGKPDRVHSFNRPPARVRGGTDLRRVGSTPRLDLPAAGPIVTTRGRAVLLITAPYGDTDRAETNYQDLSTTTSSDRSPKVLVAAPSGDFAFGTSVAVQRSLLPPWAAGDLRDRTVWGHVQRQRVSRLIFHDAMTERKLTATRPSRFKFAFIVAASDGREITSDIVDQVDVMRRYWDEALPAASRGLLQSTTDL